MKNFILLSLMLLLSITVNAQDLQLTDNGAYEKKEVVLVDSTKASILFSRAMETLTDWTGTDGRAKAGIDYQDKESGLIIYKGTYSLGFKNVMLGAGWKRYADFTLKVKCKDGRAQIIITVPTITGIYNSNGVERSYSIDELVKQVNEARGNRKKRGEALLNNLTSQADGLVSDMSRSLKGSDSDDDF